MHSPPPSDAGHDQGPATALAEQATHWVVRLTSGETSAAEIEAFRRWRDASPDHAAALAKARREWALLGHGFDALAEKAAPRRPWAQISAIAATLVVAVIAGQQGLSHFNHDYVTQAGERRVVRLADGSTMIVSARSAVDVRFDQGRRSIALVRGEAYFDVARDPAKRPFSVQVGDEVVRDIGTAFSVRKHGDGGEVVVAQGEVQVIAQGGAGPIIVRPDQAAAFGAGADRAVRPVRAADQLGWTQGRLVIVDQPLSEVVRQINLHAKDQVLVLRPEVGARRVTAVIALDNIDAWLGGLSQSGVAKASRLGSVVVIR